MEIEADIVNKSLTNGHCDEQSYRQVLRNDMLDHLSKSKEAHFKSQQLGDPELLNSEKRTIAAEILDKNCGTFLARFGSYILEKHLDYFKECSEEQRYEVEFYLQQLRTTFKKNVSKVKVKNRRFEALKKLVSEGSYFSEYEMKKRNPLLYENLVGQYLTDEEEKERTGIDTSNITFVNLLLEQYDRDEMKKFKKRQLEDEDNQMEEEDDEDEIESNDEMECNDNEDDTFNDEKICKTLWGEDMKDKSQLPPCLSSESSTSKPQIIVDELKINKKKQVYNIDKPKRSEELLTDEEKNILMEEFRSSMFNSFLEGKDQDFDYEEIDKNSDYDDLEMRRIDEEEKYFDSESPIEHNSNEISTVSNGVEEEPDIGNAQCPSTNEITDGIRNLQP